MLEMIHIARHTFEAPPYNIQINTWKFILGTGANLKLET
jgi:hypothetical protein